MSREITDWIFSTPWWLPTIIIAVGVALWVSGNKRTDKTLKLVGLAAVFLGAALALVSRVVETRAETVTRRSRELVKAVVERQWKTAESLLDPKVTLKVQGAPFGLQYSGRDEMLKGARIGVDRVGVNSATVTHVEVQDSGPLLTASLRIFSTHDRAGGPHPSDWQIAWEDAGDGNWTATEITLIRFGSLTGEQAKGNLP